MSGSGKNAPFRNALVKHPAILVGAVVLTLLLVWGFWPKAILVDTVETKLAPLTVSIEEDGKTRVIDRYIISAPVNGMTCKMHLKVGQAVEQGKTLLSISPLPSPVLDARSRAEAEQKVASARAAVSSAKQQANAAQATAMQARLEVKRYQPLLEKGLISQDVYDKAETASLSADANLRSAQFQVDVANHELQAALTSLEYSSGESYAANASGELEQVAVKSPVNGKILKVSRDCKGPVNVGESLLEVGDPNALEIEVDVLSADAVKIKPGMLVRFKRWGGDDILEGHVRLIEPVGFTKTSALGVEEQRVWIISDFTSPIDQWSSLGDGYRVEAEFILWHDDSVLQVPSSAVFRYQEGWAAFTAENDTAQIQQVEIGKRNGLTVQIISGLVEGQMVINHPNESIEEGTKIKLN